MEDTIASTLEVEGSLRTDDSGSGFAPYQYRTLKAETPARQNGARILEALQSQSKAVPHLWNIA
jgi:hypothetical protein